MRFRVGDKVKFLNNIGGGRITKIIDNDYANVLAEDGFEVPSLLSELIKIAEDALITGGDSQENFETLFKKDPQLHNDSLKKDKIAGKENPDEVTIYCAFVPQNIDLPAQSDLDLYIINDSELNCFYNYIIPKEPLYQGKNHGIIEPNTKIFLESIIRKELNNFSEIIFQLVPFAEGYYEAKKPAHKELKISPVKFFKEKSYKLNDFFEEKSIIIEIYGKNQDMIEDMSSEDLKKIIEKKEIENEQINKPKTSVKRVELEEIVDLHIHELIEDERTLSKHEMLNVQLDYFRSAMESAIKNRLKKIIFIHGVGNGKLKIELRKELDIKYKNFTYQDASFAEYGYGATMVILR